MRGNKQISAATDDNSDDRVVVRTETGSGNTFNKHPNYQGNQYNRGQGHYRGRGRRGTKRTDSSSCFYLCSESSEHLGACV